jgi:hypothetical protein
MTSYVSCREGGKNMIRRWIERHAGLPDRDRIARYAFLPLAGLAGFCMGVVLHPWPFLAAVCGAVAVVVGLDVAWWLRTERWRKGFVDW